MSGLRTRLAPEVLDRVTARARTAVAVAGLDGLLSDSPEDVAHLTGCFHHPCERPVAVLLAPDGEVVLLVPELEVAHAQDQHARARLVSYAEYPGLRNPFEPLVAGLLSARLGVATSITQHRLTLLQEASGRADWVPTAVLEGVRAVKEPEEVALHR